MVFCAQIDEREAANWWRTRPQENAEPAGAGGRKYRKNIDAAAYGKTRGKNMRVWKQEVSDRTGSKSSATANGKLAGLEKKHLRRE